MPDRRAASLRAARPRRSASGRCCRCRPSARDSVGGFGIDALRAGHMHQDSAGMNRDQAAPGASGTTLLSSPARRRPARAAGPAGRAPAPPSRTRGCARARASAFPALDALAQVLLRHRLDLGGGLGAFRSSFALLSDDSAVDHVAHLLVDAARRDALRQVVGDLLGAAALGLVDRRAASSRSSCRRRGSPGRSGCARRGRWSGSGCARRAGSPPCRRRGSPPATPRACPAPRAAG